MVALFSLMPDNLWQSPRWTGIAVTDCVLEGAIFCIPIWILWDLHTPISYKATIMMSFASRLL